MRLLTEAQERELRCAYEHGESISDLAKRCYVSKETAWRSLRRAGGTADRNKKNFRMIQNDWNAGMPSDRIVKVYGYAHAQSLYSMIQTLRKRGWYFASRKGGKIHGTV